MPISQNSGVYRVGAQYGVLRQQQEQNKLVLWLQRGTNMFTDVSATSIATTNDPVATWKDNATNISATQATPTARPTRQAGGELAFDGNDWLESADQVAFRVRFGFTVAAWARIVTSGGNPVFAGKDQTGGREWLLRYSNGLQFFVLNATGGTFGSTQNVGWLTNTWHLAVGTLGADNVVRGYVNGVPLAITATLAGALPATTTPLTTGRRLLDGLPDFLSGSIGDIRIWHRALDAAEIAALFAEERTSYGV